MAPAANQPLVVHKAKDFAIVTFDRIAIDEASLLRLQGYRDLENVRPAVKRMAAAMARQTEALIDPHAYYRVLNIQSFDGYRLEVGEEVVFKTEAFGRFLEQAQQIVAFVMTMGRRLDKAVIDCLAADQVLDALFLEAAGWLGIEAATRQLSGHLKARALENGQRMSPRLGPGYRYKIDGRTVIWPLEQQRTLFKLFSEESFDVELLESCAMLPKISRSGIFGLSAEL